MANEAGECALMGRVPFLRVDLQVSYGLPTIWGEGARPALFEGVRVLCIVAALRMGRAANCFVAVIPTARIWTAKKVCREMAP